MLEPNLDWLFHAQDRIVLLVREAVELEALWFWSLTLRERRLRGFFWAIVG